MTPVPSRCWARRRAPTVSSGRWVRWSRPPRSVPTPRRPARPTSPSGSSKFPTRTDPTRTDPARPSSRPGLGSHALAECPLRYLLGALDVAKEIRPPEEVDRVEQLTDPGGRGQQGDHRHHD